MHRLYDIRSLSTLTGWGLEGERGGGGAEGWSRGGGGKVLLGTGGFVYLKSWARDKSCRANMCIVLDLHRTFRQTNTTLGPI